MSRIRQTAMTTLRMIASLRFRKFIFCIKLLSAGKRPEVQVKVKYKIYRLNCHLNIFCTVCNWNYTSIHVYSKYTDWHIDSGWWMLKLFWVSVCWKKDTCNPSHSGGYLIKSSSLSWHVLFGCHGNSNRKNNHQPSLICNNYFNHL
jgi:hypothetical protein